VKQWQRSERLGFYAAIILGASLGFIVGVRRLQPAVDQDLYWVWLSLWVVGGAVLGATGGLIQHWFRRS
jgi:hypothetical protein